MLRRTTAAVLALIAGSLLPPAPVRAGDARAGRPNVVVIVSDDQGYADIGFNPHHSKEVSTPHLDALCREGVFFTRAYTSGNVCSPTRAGLMTGRYQQRVGVYTAGEGGRGFDPTVPIFPSFLPEGYVSTAIGKWHLGLDRDFPALKWHPLGRGFDDCYIFMGRGGHDYFRLKGADGGPDETMPLYRGKQRIGDEGYLTTRLTEEATAFIGRNKARPFFLYLAYNAVHAPAQSPQADVDRIKEQFPDLPESRAVLMAMLHHLDLGVGAVVRKLKDEGVWEDTLVFFLTDNGGSRAMGASNGTLRGYKGSDYEGGIRTPFVVSWPAKFEGGRTIDTPVISLDILPTAVDATGGKPPAIPFDGKSLLPLLTGQTTKHHDALYWSSGGTTGEWAVRQGDWKLRALKDQRELFDLAADPSEKMNLAAMHPEKVKRLAALYDAWLEPMAAPIAGGPKGWTDTKKGLTSKEEERLKRRKDRKQKRKAEK